MEVGFDDSEASDNETEKKGENLASPEHAKGAGGETGSGEQQVAATTRALELSRITENTSCKDEGKGQSKKRQSLHIDIQLPLPANAKTAGCSRMAGVFLDVVPVDNTYSSSSESSF